MTDIRQYGDLNLQAYLGTDDWQEGHNEITGATRRYKDYSNRVAWHNYMGDWYDLFDSKGQCSLEIREKCNRVSGWIRIEENKSRGKGILGIKLLNEERAWFLVNNKKNFKRIDVVGMSSLIWFMIEVLCLACNQVEEQNLS